MLFFKLQKCVLQVTHMSFQIKNLLLSEMSFCVSYLNFQVSGSNQLAQVKCPFLVYVARTPGGRRLIGKGEQVSVEIVLTQERQAMLLRRIETLSQKDMSLHAEAVTCDLKHFRKTNLSEPQVPQWKSGHNNTSLIKKKVVNIK